MKVWYRGIQLALASDTALRLLVNIRDFIIVMLSGTMSVGTLYYLVKWLYSYLIFKLEYRYYSKLLVTGSTNVTNPPRIILDAELVTKDGKFAYKFNDGETECFVIAPEGQIPSVKSPLKNGLTPEMAASTFKSMPAPAPKSQVFFISANITIGSGSRIGSDLILTNQHVHDELMRHIELELPVTMHNSTLTKSLKFDPAWAVDFQALDLCGFKVPLGALATLEVAAAKVASPVSGSAVKLYGLENGKMVQTFSIIECRPDFGPLVLAHKANTDHGWSGSPMYNKAGKIVGVHTGAIHRLKTNVGIALDFLRVAPTIEVETVPDTKSYKIKFWDEREFAEHRAEKLANRSADERDREEEAEREFEFGATIRGTKYKLVAYRDTFSVDATQGVGKRFNSAKMWADMEEDDSLAEESTATSPRKADFQRGQTRRGLAVSPERHNSSTSNSTPVSRLIQKALVSPPSDGATQSAPQSASPTKSHPTSILRKESSQSSKSTPGLPVEETPKGKVSSTKTVSTKEATTSPPMTKSKKQREKLRARIRKLESQVGSNATKTAEDSTTPPSSQ